MAAQIFKSPSKFLDACASQLLETRDVPANLALASTYQLASERPGEDCEGSTWISLTVPRNDASLDPVLFTISAVETYPCVLASSVNVSQLDPTLRVESMRMLAAELRAAGLPTSRVSAVVGPRVLVEPLADAWAKLQGIKRQDKPLLHMFLSFVTENTLRDSTREAAGIAVGPAQESDLDEFARMFEAFTSGRAHSMSRDAGKGFATSLIARGHLFSGSVDGKIAGLTTVTRPIPGVRAISTVWTDEVARGKGLAEAMVREGCKHAFAEGIGKVCLFVEPTNPGAARVYGRVGFVGLETGLPDESTEEWMELGFEDVKLQDWM